MNGLLTTYRDVLRSYYGQVKERTEQRFVFYRYVYRPLSFPLSALAIRAGLSADAVTLANLAVLVAAIIAACAGSLLLCAALFFVYYVLDFVDGNIARYAGVSSYFGKLIDGMVDTLSFILFAAVAVGNVRSGSAMLGAELEIALGVAATISALLRQNYRWRLAYLRSEMGLTLMADAHGDKPQSGAGEQQQPPIVVWLFDNAATSTPIVLLLAVSTGFASMFVALFFVLYGIAGNVETLISIAKNRSALLERRDH